MVGELESGGMEQIGLRVCLLRDLDPKFACVYDVVGAMVKDDASYAPFCTLEREVFDSVNQRQKPTKRLPG